MHRLRVPLLFAFFLSIAEVSFSTETITPRVAFREPTPQLRIEVPIETVPTAPSLLTAAAISANEIKLQWVDESDHETGFLLERKIASTDFFVPVASIPANATQYKDSDLLMDTRYVYRIRSENDLGTSDPSNEATAKTTSIPKTPNAPTCLTATSTSHLQVYMTWQDESLNETCFKIERKGLSEIVFSPLVTVPGNTTVYQDDTVMACQDYVYRIKASNETGDSEYSNTTQVTVISPIIVGALGAGHTHSVALKDDGTVWTWGGNHVGQLGTGNTNDQRIPQLVALLTNQVMEVNAGAHFSVALTTDGKVWSWGANQSGQLGDGTTSSRWIPTLVKNLEEVDVVDVGQDYALAVNLHGLVFAWGKNDYGQLGLPPSIRRKTTPTPIPGFLGPINEVSAGAAHSIALQSDGTVWTWGANSFGQLGIGMTNKLSTLTQVPGLANVMKVAAGNYFSLVLKSDGSVWSWGRNTSGQLGTGTIENQWLPTPVLGLPQPAIDINAGGNHSVAVLRDGTLWSWGANTYGQLGDQTIENRLLPVPAATTNAINIISTAVGHHHTTSLRSDGTVWSSGANRQGQLGNNTNKSSSVPVKALNLDLLSNP